MKECMRVKTVSSFAVLWPLDLTHKILLVSACAIQCDVLYRVGQV